MSRRTIVTLAVAVAALAAALPAHAAGNAELTEVAGQRFPERSFVLTLPRREALTTADVQVRENGQDVKDLEVTPGGAAGARGFGTMLVIDTSQSMRGAPIVAAMAAAREFVAHRPAGQRVGVIFFDRSARLALRPTTDAGRLASVLAGPPQLDRGTRIYDATAMALRELARDRITVGSLIVLSDGADVGSSLSAAEVTSRARRARARVYAVGARSRTFAGGSLRAMAVGSGGRYAEADGGRLSALFAALGTRMGREYLVTYKSLARLGGRVAVEATVARQSATATAAYVAPPFSPPGSHAGSRQGPEHAAASAGATLLAGSLAVALVLGGCVFMLVRPSRRTLTDRIADFTDGSAAAEPPREISDALAKRHRQRSSARWLKFAEDVDVAQLQITPERLAVVTLAGTAALAVTSVVLGRVALATLLLLAPVFVRVFVASKAGRQRREFETQLPDNLQVVASAMRAGQSFVGAVAVAVEDAAEPFKRELQRAVTDERLGVSLDEAIGRVADRMRSEELAYVGLVAALQRNTGGNTAEVLDRITETIRARAELSRLVRTLTAQGRLGGGVVTALPLLAGLFFAVTRPDYFDPLTSSPGGLTLLAAGGAMLVAGWLVIRKIVDIKV
jgi:tight adherence protein B